MTPEWTTAGIAALGAMGTLIGMAYSVGMLKGVITTRLDALAGTSLERHNENGRRMDAIEHRLGDIEGRLGLGR